MKPFDLERAMAGDPICFRNGTPAKFIAYVPEAPNHQQIIVLVCEPTGKTFIVHRYSNGEFDRQHHSVPTIDLMMASKTVKATFLLVRINGDCNPHVIRKNNYAKHIHGEILKEFELEWEE
jgi:hypothetical protein